MAAGGGEQPEGTAARGDRDSAQPGELKLQVLVASPLCGAIIGKGGDTIKQLQDESGARVHVQTDPLPQSNERQVTLTGTPEVCRSRTSGRSR
eukprot:SAG22_NODE_1429_length_4441_cov_39.877476_3_plen_93_part_00